MTTVSVDAITAVSTNADLSLDGSTTGGVSIASTLKMKKGGDISSASPLVIDTDGNYFDVTGTTNFSAMTVEEGNFFMLQFDGALTITHGSGIEIPGAANLTTAAGDRLMCYATAANTVIVMHKELEAVPATFGQTFISNTDISSAATYDFTAFTAGSYEHYVFYLQNLIPATDAVHLWCRTSTDATNYDSGASDYDWSIANVSAYTAAFYGDVDKSDSRISLTGDGTDDNLEVGSQPDTEFGVSGIINLYGPHTTSYTHLLGWFVMDSNASGNTTGLFSSGKRLSAADVDGFRLLFSSGNIESGTITAYGINNS